MTWIPLLFLAVACGGKEDGASSSGTVVTDPAALACDAQKNVLTLHVTASGPFQVYPADGVDWVSVDPPYSASSSGEVSVTVGENVSYRERSTEITVRCGSNRHKVALVQAAMEKGQLDIDVPAGYHLVWREEFDVDGTPSTEDWWYETGGGGWGNNESQVYVAGSREGIDLATISDGSLKIQARKIGDTVYSIRMNTRRYWTYGWFEARLKVSDARGSWPAFWMMPQHFTTWPGDGEIDIMEYAISTQGRDKVSSSIHCNAFNWPAGTQKTHVTPITHAASEYHVYALEWTSERMRFYVDGNVHLTFDNDGNGYNHWPFNAPFYLKFNMAWGGNMGGTTAEGDLPATYEVDYVRVFQKD